MFNSEQFSRDAVPGTCDSVTQIHLFRAQAALSFLKRSTHEWADQKIEFYGEELEAIFDLIHDEVDKASTRQCELLMPQRDYDPQMQPG
jgi:hypothetical protein